MTLRNLLFIVLGTLSALLILVAGMSARDAWTERQVAGEVADAVEDTDPLLDAALALVEERDIMRVALVAPGAVRRGDMAALRESRAESNAAIGQSLEHIREEGQFADRDRLTAALEEQLRVVADLRRSADGLTAKGGDEADYGLARDWAEAMDLLINRAEELRLAATREANEADAATATHSTLKHLTLVMADYAGRERASLAEFIAEDMPLPPGRLQQLFGFRGRVEMAWDTLAEGVAASGDPALAAAAEEVNKQFMTSFGKTRDAVLRAGVSARAYPVGAAGWLDAATGAIASIHGLERGLGEANEKHLDAKSTAAGSWLVLLIVLLGAGLTASAFSFGIVARRVVGPLKAMTTAMTWLADGDTTVEIPAAGRKDEIGEMASAVQVFKDNAIEKQRLEEEQAAGQLRAEEEKRQAMNELADRFERQVKEVVDGVSSSASEMQATAQQMSSTAEQASGQAGAVATASNQATVNVQTVATATEELSASIAEIGRQVSQSAKVASNAVSEAEATNATVQGLAEAASKIGEVVNLINDIAGQTNLLALNATIEAARAGDAGKGFAVVAQEVKNLASQTAKATEEISTQIGAVQEETAGAVGAIEKIRDIIGEINDISTTIASAVEEQGVSTQEIARNVQQAAQGTQEVNTNIAGVTEAASQTGVAANQVLSSSGELSKQAEKLRGQVDEFLRDVRSA